MSSAIRPVIGLLRPVRRLVYCSLALEALAAIGLLVPLVAAAELARSALASDGVPAGWLWAAAAGALVYALGHGAASLLVHVADNRLQLRLRRRALAVFESWPVSRLDAAGSATVKRAAGDDVDALHHVIGHGLPDALTSLVVATAGLVWMLTVSVPLTAAAIAPMGLALALQRRQRRRLPAQMARYQDATEELDRAALELARTAPLLASHGAGADRFTAAAGRWAGFVRGWARDVTPTMAAQQVLLSGTAALLALSLAMLSGGATLLPAAVAIAIVVPAVASPLWSLAFATQELAAGSAAAGRLCDLLDSADAAPRPVGGVRWPGTPPAVAVRSVTVRYGEQVALRPVTAQIPAGTMATVVGPSGAGKSTLVGCLAGLVEHGGTVEIDGVPLRAIDPTERAEHLAVVWQTPHQLRASLRDTLTLGRPGVTDSECLDALARVGLAERARALPHGLDTIVGGALTLSGGERQRLSLARALLAEPDLLVLDEPTSWVDPTTAAVVDEVVASLRGRCTVVRSDHRPSVAAAADCVVTVGKGVPA